MPECAIYTSEHATLWSMHVSKVITYDTGIIMLNL